MKKFIPLILILVLALYATAQIHRFADTTAQWYMTTYENGWQCGGCVSYYTNSFSVIGENTINMHVYQNINNAFIRNDSTRKVYRYFDDHETLIYDFDKSVGDTFTLISPWGGGMNALCTVDSVDSIWLNYPRKRMYVTLDGYGIKHDQWVEGVGSLYSDFLNPAVEVISFDGPTYSLRCFFELDSLLLHVDINDSRCDIDSSTVDILEPKVVSLSYSIYPNPSSSSITLSQQPQPNTAILIYDALGRIVRQEELATSTQQINVAELADGIYTYAITQQGVRQASGKLVVSH